MSVLYDDIGELVTNDPAAGDGTALGVVNGAALVTDDGVYLWIGAPTIEISHRRAPRHGMPGFVDSHAHLIFAGDRAASSPPE
jgi:imidazolonepropionase